MEGFLRPKQSASWIAIRHALTYCLCGRPATPNPIRINLPQERMMFHQAPIEKRLQAIVGPGYQERLSNRDEHTCEELRIRLWYLCAFPSPIPHL